MPKENRGRLTEPYVTTREKGTGLGLAIVKRIMEEHGGKLHLSDAPRRPGRRVGRAGVLGIPQGSKLDREGWVGFMAADILVVDDEADIRQLIGGILEDEGYEARLAGDSDSALAAIVERRPRW